MSSFKLGRLFDTLDRGDGPMLGAGRGSMGSLRSFSLPFIPEEVVAAEEDPAGEIVFSAGTFSEEEEAGDESREEAGSVAVPTNV